VAVCPVSTALDRRRRSLIRSPWRRGCPPGRAPGLWARARS